MSLRLREMAGQVGPGVGGRQWERRRGAAGARPLRRDLPVGAELRRRRAARDVLERKEHRLAGDERRAGQQDRQFGGRRSRGGQQGGENGPMPGIAESEAGAGGGQAGNRGRLGREREAPVCDRDGVVPAELGLKLEILADRHPFGADVAVAGAALAVDAAIRPDQFDPRGGPSAVARTISPSV